MGINQNELLKWIAENADDDEVKAYLKSEHPRHQEVVDLVTAKLEEHFGESHPRMGLMDSSEQSIRQALYRDPREVDEQLRDIFNGHDDKWSKPYLDGNHPLHAEAVKRVSILSAAKYGDTLHAPEILPIVSQSGVANIKQAGITDPDQSEEEI